MDAFDCVKLNMQLLAFGASPAILNSTSRPYAKYTVPVENGQPSELSAATTALVRQVMFSDACPFIATVSPQGASFNVSRCQAYGGGIIRQGLVALINAWWQAGYIVGDRQLRGGFWKGNDPSNGLSYLFQGYGWMVPQSTFDYSLAQCNPPLCNLGLSFAQPAGGNPLPPTRLPDPSYTGDYNPPPVPMPVPGCTRYFVHHELFTDYQVCVFVGGRRIGL